MSQPIQPDANKSRSGTDADCLRQAADGLTKLVLEDGRTGLVIPPAKMPGVPAPMASGVSELLSLARRVVFPGFFEGGPLGEDEVEGVVGTLVARLAAHLRGEVERAIKFVNQEEHRARPGSGLGLWQSEVPGPMTGAVRWGTWRERMRGAGLHSARAQLDAHKIAEESTRRFIARLAEVRRLIGLDVQAAYEGDPAAEHTDEIILCYPGLEAVFSHRVAHELYSMGIPLLPRMIAESSHSRTGIDIHPGARIGERFFIDHGAGVVIGETTEIGTGVKIYQGVTLGAKSFPRDAMGNIVRNEKRHPTIGDRVTIYAHAVILGGDTIIGEDCIIAGGVFLTMDVPAGHVVRQKTPELTVRGNPTVARAWAKEVDVEVEKEWGAGI